jgi:hypothetical protein
MKHLFLLALATLFGFQTTQAQDSDFEYGLFNHLGVGASLGTDGIGFDLAAPLADWAAIRAGISFMPSFKYNTDINIDDNNPAITDKVNIEAKLNVFDFKALFDFYPFENSGFHITAGAFIGSSDFVTATNTSMFIKDPNKYGKLGLALGQKSDGSPYRITTDKNGYISADVKVNSIKPYFGIGFGRAVPRKSRVSVSCDFGVKFWGSPRLGAKVKDDWDNIYYHKFKSKELDDSDDEDLKDAMELVEKISVYPVLNIRITGRIF